MKGKIKSLRLYHLLIFNLLLLTFLCSSVFLFTRYTNTLFRNGQWESSKVKLEKGVMGAWSFMLTYRALAHQQLDLSTWHGEQEIFLKNELHWEELYLDIRGDEASELRVYFAKKADTVYGLHLSGSSKQLPFAFRMVDYAFVEKKSLELPLINEEWHRLHIEKQDTDYRIALDSFAIYLPLPPATTPVLGLRGGERKVLVDNIVLQDTGKNVLLYEDFSNDDVPWLWALAFFLLANTVFLLLYSYRVSWIRIILNVALLSVVLAAYFEMYGQEIYPKSWMISWKKQESSITRAEAIRDKVTESNARLSEENGVRLLFLGSSQTWGAGASREEHSFVSLYEQLINHRNPHTPVHCINGGISGIQSDLLLAFFQTDWIKTPPHLVFINLGLNDSGNPLFEQNLRQFIRLSDSAGFELVFILEPLKSFRQAHQENLDIMRRLAREHHIHCVDMPMRIREYEDQGMLYWDFVHFTDYGHRVFAEILEAETRDVVDRLFSSFSMQETHTFTPEE